MDRMVSNTQPFFTLLASNSRLCRPRSSRKPSACDRVTWPGRVARLCPGQVPEYLNAGARQFGFMLRGLKELAPRAAALNIPFFLLRGDPTATVPALVRDARAALLVTDYASLRLGRQWRTRVRRWARCRPLHIHRIGQQAARQLVAWPVCSGSLRG